MNLGRNCSNFVQFIQPRPIEHIPTDLRLSERTNNKENKINVKQLFTNHTVQINYIRVFYCDVIERCKFFPNRTAGK